MRENLSKEEIEDVMIILKSLGLSNSDIEEVLEYNGEIEE